MEEEVKKEPRKLGKGELAWYIIAGTIALLGIVFLTFGIIRDHLPVIASDNWILTSENAWLTNWSKMGYRWWGLIDIGVAVLIASIALTFYAKTGDRDSERALRRSQRINLEQATSTNEVVEVKAEDKK